MSFTEWVNEVDAKVQALTGGKTFNRLGASVQQTLRQWYDEKKTPDWAAQEWVRLSTLPRT